MKESDMQSRFSKWIRESKFQKSAAFELKLVKAGHALPYSAFQPQQLPSLLQAKHSCVYRKISDADRGIKPYDCSQICNADAWVVIGWYRPRKPIKVYWIDIDTFMSIKDSSKRKSLTEEQALAISSKIIYL